MSHRIKLDKDLSVTIFVNHFAALIPLSELRNNASIENESFYHQKYNRFDFIDRREIIVELNNEKLLIKFSIDKKNRRFKVELSEMIKTHEDAIVYTEDQERYL